MGFEIKKDKYSEARGGESTSLNIFCQKCERVICFYQKDGDGPLKRLYRDRMWGGLPKFEGKVAKCPECKNLIGYCYIYDAEGRPAINLFVGGVFSEGVK